MKNKLLLFIVFLLAMAVPRTALAYAFSSVSPSGDTLYYNLNGNGVTVVSPAFDWNGYTKPTGDLIIPEFVSYMGMALPVKSIESAAFYNCQEITSVFIPSSVTSIGSEAFESCINLVSVTLPDSLTYIDLWTFVNCTSLTSISIPNSVTEIRGMVFPGCTSLTSLTIPSTVTYIWDNAFDGCNNISYLNYNTNAFRPAQFPHDNLQTVVIGDSVTSIPANAFQNATNLSHVTIGSGVTSIGDYAFCFCSSLNTIVALPDNAPSIGSNVFYGTPSTKNVIVNCGTDYATVWGTTGFIYSNGYILALESNNALYGTASIVQPVDCQQTAIIQATPAARCVFTGWSDGNTDNPRTITLTGNTTLTANFALTREVVAQSANEVMGTTEGSGIYVVGSEVTLSAIATCGFRFTHWQDGEVSNPRTITLGDDTVFTAYFELHSDTVVLHDTAYVDVHDTTYINVHDTTYVDVPYAVHDTTIVIDTLTLTEYVPVHDTTYIDVHDTTYVDVPYAIHDTTVVIDTLTLTEYVPVHDTTYIDVHDTTYVDVPYAVHDTTVVTDTIVNTIYDTTIVTDTITQIEYVPVHDTTVVTLMDTVINTVFDTVVNTVYDTVDNYIYDTVTNTIYDTVTNTLYDTIDNYIYDTTIVTDTLWLTEYDTIYITDTIIIHDTVYVTDEGIDAVQTANIRLYQRNGSIVVEEVDGGMLPEVMVYDAVGRQLSGERRVENVEFEMPVPVSGMYLVKVGDRQARRIVVVK